jgi:acetylornithine deacetylase/succinyl-diaminopimelate desuccinylase-like protein
VVNTFWQQLRKPILLMGLGLDSDGAHAPNERFKIDNFVKGAKASAYLLNNIQS